MIARFLDWLESLDWEIDRGFHDIPDGRSEGAGARTFWKWAARVRNRIFKIA